MSVLYLDTSALVKRYVAETGSAWLNTLFDSPETSTRLVTRLAAVEAACAFARRAREGTLPPDILARTLHLLDDDLRCCCHVLELTPGIVGEAQRLALAHPLRAYDAVHLATARLAAQELEKQAKWALSFCPPTNNYWWSPRLLGSSPTTPTITHDVQAYPNRPHLWPEQTSKRAC